MGRERLLGLSVAFCYISRTLRIAASLDGKMSKVIAVFISVLISGCALEPRVYPKANPYDSPEGYVVYKPYAGYQRWDGRYLSGFYSSGWQYLDNCVATGPLVPNKILQASIRYSDKDDVVYLNYAGGPSRARCDIKYDVIKTEVDRYISDASASEAARIDAEIKEEQVAESRRVAASERLKKARKENPKESATGDAIELFVKYCEALKDATGNASYIDSLRSMKHEYVGPGTNSLMYIYATNLFHNTGGSVYCQYAIPQVKERIYSLGIYPTK